MKVPDFLVRFIGRRIAKKIDLQETKMEDTKVWYKSKGVWTGVVIVVISAYETAAQHFGLPPIPAWAYTLLGAMGIYTRATADTKVTAKK